MAIITRAEVKTLLQIENSYTENESITFTSMAMSKLANKPNVNIIYVSKSTINSTETTRYSTLDYYTTQDAGRSELIKRIDTGTIGDTQTVYISYTYNDYDSYIDNLIPKVQADIVEYLNNIFPDKNTTYLSGSLEFYSSGAITDSDNARFEIEGFTTGMDIAVEGTYRNRGIYNINTLTTDKITLSTNDTILDECSSDEYGSGAIRLTRVVWPQGLKNLIAQIIWYNIKDVRAKDIKSKSIGPSSVTYTDLGSGGYPDNIYKGLARYTNLDIM